MQALYKKEEKNILYGNAWSLNQDADKNAFNINQELQKEMKAEMKIRKHLLQP